MALNTINGIPGLVYGRFSSQAVPKDIGKFTDYSLLTTLQRAAPADYDRKIISLYSQLGIYKNDFLELLNSSNPYYIKGGVDTFGYDVLLPYENNKIIDIPASTYSQTVIGGDGKEFEFVTARKLFKNDVVALGSLEDGDQVHVTQDPVPYNGGWLVKATSIRLGGVSKKWLSVGNDVKLVNNLIGEYDQDYTGLESQGERLRLFHTIGADYGVEHTITGWADDVKFDGMTDANGRPKDLLVYMTERRGEMPSAKNYMAWEPYVEFAVKRKMLTMRVQRAIWSKDGVAQTNGGRHDLKKQSLGVYHGMKEYGHYIPFNKGDFSLQTLRDAFGDLFYGKVDVANRHVKMYTNEAGIQLFQKALKDDALASGITLTSEVPAIHQGGEITPNSPSQKLIYAWNFGSMYSTETGTVEVVHLAELDYANMNGDYGNGRKTKPKFLVFDITNSGNGFSQNIREIRIEGRPNMVWGYMDGLRHHNGAFASQGHSMGHKADSYTIVTRDRSDIFVEDYSKLVLIEEKDY